MPDCFDRLDCRHLLLEYFFGNELAQDSVYAKDIDEYLKIEVSGKIAQSEFLLHLISDQDGIDTCANGEKKDCVKKNVIHCPDLTHSFNSP